METPHLACNAWPMPKRRQPCNDLDIEIVWKPEVVEAWERGEIPPAMYELATHLAKIASEQDLKELEETGDCRWMSSDPNVDWVAHDARWAKKDAEAALRREEAIVADKARKEQERERRRAQKAREALASQAQAVPQDINPPNMARLSISRRLEIVDEIAAAHPGKPMSKMLLELFPELHEVQHP